MYSWSGRSRLDVRSEVVAWPKEPTPGKMSFCNRSEGKTEWIGDFANLSFVDVGG